MPAGRCLVSLNHILLFFLSFSSPAGVGEVLYAGFLLVGDSVIPLLLHSFTFCSFRSLILDAPRARFDRLIQDDQQPHSFLQFSCPRGSIDLVSKHFDLSSPSFGVRIFLREEYGCLPFRNHEVPCCCSWPRLGCERPYSLHYPLHQWEEPG